MAGSEELKQNLISDMAKAKEVASNYGATTASNLGEPSESFQAKSQFIQKKSAIDDALSTSKQAIDDLAANLVRKSGIVDELEQTKMATKIKDKLNQMRLYYIRQAAMINKQVTLKQISAEKQKALLGALSGAAELGGALAVKGIGSNFGSGGGGPDLGSQFGGTGATYGQGGPPTLGVDTNLEG